MPKPYQTRKTTATVLIETLYWNQIELFLRDHSAAKFSHGICPECAKTAYPDLYAKMQKK